MNAEWQEQNADAVIETTQPSPQLGILTHGDTVSTRHTDPVPWRVTSRLYTSHLLSTWNSRSFELGAVLFIASIYPHTLRPLSVYAIVRNGAAIVLSPAVGTWIDHADRLVVVRWSIVGQRLAVAISCAIFWILLVRKHLQPSAKSCLFGLAVILACIEKLCSVMNLVSVERDWVVVIARGDDDTRLLLNARMRRIDLFCKLLGPLIIALINGSSTLVAVWVTLAMNIVSVFVEYFAIGAVFRSTPALRRARWADGANAADPATTSVARYLHQQSLLQPIFSYTRQAISLLFPLKSYPLYFHHSAFLPSISLSMLYLTVLSLSGQMITFLLAVGFSSSAIGATRLISTLCELSATWLAPKVQRHIGPVRGGIWFLTWQMLWLACALTWFFSTSDHPDPPSHQHQHAIFSAAGLVAAVILSRIGLWGFDLCAQAIVQESVAEDARGSFSTVEASFQNLFELLSYVTTIIFARVEQFRWPMVISVVAVYAAGGTYAVFVRKRRGHLLHQPGCLKC